MNAATRSRSTSRTTGLAATFEDERYTWTRRRTVRRAAVGVEAAVVGFLTGVPLVAALGGADGAAPVVCWVAACLVFIPVHSVVNLGVRGVFDRRETTLDEVQRAMRDAATSAVNPLRVVLGLLAVVAAVLVAQHGGGTASGLAVGFALWFASWLLSTWHLAWTLPDEED
ncbi:hypothetical protein ACUN7V_07025 [Quadrisphaera oryzae]|uniref:hypothetical protein n=1 Tax=Quadrisphaera TaxID=317661 RepID=UPI001644CACC|nr:hypothetical protein [Quadrisphaera sp. RL12-1S]MBC3763651.1 hypothetical protein [Quadrisphaera sp. RL12-1S]